MAKRQEIKVGTVFGRLTYLFDVPPRKAHFRRARFACACGVEKDIDLGPVRDGRVISCGCWRKEKIVERSTTHGHARRGAKSRTRSAWSEMRKRCARHPDYAGRGIKICDRWDSFANFLADMGEAPPGRSLDRIDNNGNYEPANCRWATPIQQANNKRDTSFVEYRGRVQPMAEWARELGFKYWTLRNRIVNLGWPIERAFTTPAIVGRNQFR